jgi:proton glutamate symport protein
MAMERMEAFGVPKHVVGFVMPAGYTFNLDGTTLYLSMASVFVMQAVATTVAGFSFDIGQQITMMFALMITSKGVAAVPRASLVILLATLSTFLPPHLQHYGPIAVAMIFGVDEFMDMARTSVNLVGNCLASVVVARWEGVFDDAKAKAYQRVMTIRPDTLLPMIEYNPGAHVATFTSRG